MPKIAVYMPPSSPSLVFFPSSLSLVFSPSSLSLVFSPSSLSLVFSPSSLSLVFFPSSLSLVFFPFLAESPERDSAKSELITHSAESPAGDLSGEIIDAWFPYGRPHPSSLSLVFHPFLAESRFFTFLAESRFFTFLAESPERDSAKSKIFTQITSKKNKHAGKKTNPLLLRYLFYNIHLYQLDSNFRKIKLLRYCL